MEIEVIRPIVRSWIGEGREKGHSPNNSFARTVIHECDKLGEWLLPELLSKKRYELGDSQVVSLFFRPHHFPYIAFT